MMRTSLLNQPRNTLILLIASALSFGLQAAEIKIPLQGNTFLTEPIPGRGNIKNGQINIRDHNQVYSVYVHVNKPAKLKLFATIKSSAISKLEVSHGEQSQQIASVDGTLDQHPILKANAKQKGYVRIDFKLADKAAQPIAISDFRIVTDESDDLQLDYVRNNNGNMFYWGRRGPSVHLRYSVPKANKIRYAYTEVTVPEGQDTIGSFYMANGFGQGYFGFQVNSASERRVLFSIWSPFKTNNPKEIPVDQRIIKLNAGTGVHIGQFGNEGSGGQSYLVYPWKAGQTYRFLTEVIPQQDDKTTTYTSWFSEKSEDWKLIASFKRPKTSTNLTGFHSFLENFAPTTGHIGRRANYSNIWVGDIDGDWHECTEATFSVDATGRGRHRLDYLGGSNDNAFFLQNCGFFNHTGKPGQKFTRQSSTSRKPNIQINQLPR